MVQYALDEHSAQATDRAVVSHLSLDAHELHASDDDGAVKLCSFASRPGNCEPAARQWSWVHLSAAEQK